MDESSVLITGASGDIGQALVAALAENHPGKPLLLTRNAGELANANAEILQADMCSPASLKSLCSTLSERNVSHYIQLHGAPDPGDSILEISPRSMRRAMMVNLHSTIRVLQAILPRMISSNFGRIVLVGTASAAHGGGKNSFAYGLAKTGSEYVAAHIGKHYAPANILANCVNPGFIATRFHTKRLGRSENDLEQRARSVPVGRAGQPQDVARMLYQLAFQNDFITGQAVTIDGGDFL